ncbi:spore coat protein YsxE [Pallidibacillus pasinlerensis]|uniref:Spore coat protein YsxE n=1 Tax=Pallidibacillus pasinlerensis TaxID=2703818 RepID=A0ABX0A0L0_9BACI|nr:spore coat protein YsxE [Pallidibacillus pasinlerensis]NCU16951.1 spore coat protein YsxE [Pallidibacillus pasinlerensis]
MDENEELLVRDILREYNIIPDHIVPYGKVYRIYSRDKSYALKEMPAHQSVNFYNTFQILYTKGFHRFVPIYPTKNYQYGVMRNNKLYYLAPWIEGKQDEKTEYEKQMFRELARLHHVTAQQIKVDKEVIEEHYERLNLQWKKEMEVLDVWMQQAEQKWYMSPFEWEFVQYYNEYRKAYEYALKRLEDWKKKMLEEKKMRSVLVHGKLEPDHYLLDENGYGYFINFERSRIGSSFHDLLPYLSRALNTYPKQCEECIEWIYTYMRNNPLQETEKLLLKSYLAHPGFMFRLLEKYMTRTAANHERKMTTRIQKSYWRLKNTEYVISRMEQIDQQQKQAAEQNQSGGS